MATITGLTAEAMAAIRDGAIVGATVNGSGHLILTHFDGSTVDVGSVAGPQGDVGPAGLSLANIATKNVLDVGLAGQVRAGRDLTLADFSTLCALPSTPIALFNLADLSNLGSAGVLTNKGAVGFASGITGAANQAAQFTGSTAQALYILDTGANDPFRIKAGSVGCWFRTAKRSTYQALISKFSSGSYAYSLAIDSNNTLKAAVSFDGVTVAAVNALNSMSDICDDRWHHVVWTFDGTMSRLYVDGALEAQVSTQGLLFPATAPFNIGAEVANAGTNASNPMFGRIDEAFVTQDILTAEQVRLLYCAKIVHGYASTPKMVILNVRRRRKGPALVSGDFPSQPVRLYNLSDLNDGGSNNVPLTANQGTGAIVQAAGPDGVKDSARHYSGAHTGDSGTDAGLPQGTASRSLGAWIKTNNTAAVYFLAYGSGGLFGIGVQTGGNIITSDGVNNVVGSYVADGNWHHVVITAENAPIDGLKQKLYVDGRLVGTLSTLNATVLGGANRFRIGSREDGTSPYTGLVARAFVHASVLTPEQIQSLYAKGAQDLGISPKNPGDHIEAFDATSIYATFDTLESQNQVDLAVAA